MQKQRQHRALTKLLVHGAKGARWKYLDGINIPRDLNWNIKRLKVRSH